MPEQKNAYSVAIETSGRIGSVAIGQENTVISESSFSGFMKHSAELFDTLNSLLVNVDIDPAQIGQLYVTAGPGSFTGIRIAVTLAKMVSYAIGTPIVAVDTLDALAENATEYLSAARSPLTRVATILDAKQGRFFSALYERHGNAWSKLCPSSLIYPEELLTLIKEGNVPVGLTGEGLTYYADKFTGPLTHVIEQASWSPTARSVYAVGRRAAEQGLFSDPALLIPAYIRKPDALEKWEQKNTLI